jgi:hypothetical protein
MTIQFPSWVKTTTCENQTMSRLIPRGITAGFIDTTHGAVRVQVSVPVRPFYVVRSVGSGKMYPSITPPCAHGNTSMACHECEEAE